MQELIYRTYAVTLFCVTKPCFACGSMVRSDRFVCGVSARSAETPHTLENGVPRCRRLARPTA